MKGVFFFFLILVLPLAEGCTRIDPVAVNRSFCRALPAAEDSPLVGLVPSAAAAPEPLSGGRLISSGLEAFAARIALADNAVQSLDIQYYIFREEDLTGLLLLQQLLTAADRGVRVRLLLDDLHFRDDAGLLANLTGHPSIELRIFNPFLYRHSLGPGRLWEVFSDFRRLHRRMHNKLFVADNLAALVGGRNIGDEYFEANELLDLEDLDVLLAGPVVPELSNHFDRFWNSLWALPMSALRGSAGSPENLAAARIHLAEQIATPRAREFRQRVDDLALGQAFQNRAGPPMSPAATQVIADPPCKLIPDQCPDTLPEFSRFDHLLDQAERELLIITPYFIPGRKGVKHFRQLAKRGLRIRALTNSFAATDHKIVHAAYQRYRRPLLKQGVELYEFKPSPQYRRGRTRRRTTEERVLLGSSQACLHTKAYVIDERMIFIGSFNHDPRSMHYNSEIGVLLESPDLTRDLLEHFHKLSQPENAFQLQLEKRPQGSVGLLWKDGKAARSKYWRTEPQTFWWDRFGNHLLAWLIPESLL